jgi:3-hydroxyisobutyrate dehydrogenase-like beta-hydroxyacid dehydrogenase
LARCLIIGCGCRGLLLARELVRRGHPVRATTRDPLRVQQLAERGVEGVVADPDRIATLIPALEHVGAVGILLGSAVGTPEALAALHSTRLEMLLLRMLDTTVRGVVYEAVGTVDPAILAAGGERVRSFCDESRIPYELLDDARLRWPADAADAIDRVLAPR